jgi:hypothetical protein
MYPDHVPAGQ